MPENNNYKLYKALSDPSKRLYTKSYNEFVTQFGSEEKQLVLYNALSAPERMLYTKSFDEFKTQFFSGSGIPSKKEKEVVKNQPAKTSLPIVSESELEKEELTEREKYVKKVSEAINNPNNKTELLKGLKEKTKKHFEEVRKSAELRGEEYRKERARPKTQAMLVEEGIIKKDQTLEQHRERFKNDPEYRKEVETQISNAPVRKKEVVDKYIAPEVKKMIVKYYPELKDYTAEDVNEFTSFINRPFLQRVVRQNPHVKDPYPKNKFVNEILKDPVRAKQLREEFQSKPAIGITMATLNEMEKVSEIYAKATADDRLGVTNLILGTGAGMQNYIDSYIELVKTIDNNKYIKSVEDRIKEDGGASLTKDEKIMLQTLVEQSKIMGDINAHMPTMRQVGDQTGHSLGFMAEFILTSGGWVKSIGTVSKAAVGTTRFAQYANLSAKLSESVAQSFIMPSFYKNTLETMSKGERSGWQSTMDALYESTVENFSERLFIGNLGSKTATTTFGKFLERSGSALSGQKGWKGVGIGMGEEYLEEKFADLFQIPHQIYVNDQSDNSKPQKLFNSIAESYKEYFDLDRNIQTALSTGIITGVMGSANQAMTGLHKRSMNKYGKNIPSYLKEYIDNLALNENLTHKEAFKKVNNYIMQLSLSGEFGTEKKDLDNAYGYASLALSELFSEDIREQYKKMEEQKIKDKERGEMVSSATPVETVIPEETTISDEEINKNRESINKEREKAFEEKIHISEMSKKERNSFLKDPEGYLESKIKEIEDKLKQNPNQDLTSTFYKAQLIEVKAINKKYDTEITRLEEKKSKPVEEKKEEEVQEEYGVYELVPEEGKEKKEGIHGFYIRKKGTGKPVVDTPFESAEEAEKHIEETLKGKVVPYQETLRKIVKAENVFDEYNNARALEDDEVLYESLDKKEREAFDVRKKELEDQIVNEMHDDKALTEESTSLEYIDKDEKLTIQRRVSGKTINSPAVVVEKNQQGIVVKYNNGQTETISPRTKARIYKNYEDKVDIDLSLSTDDKNLDKKSGRIVYATSGMGKSTFVKQYSEDNVDSDVILAETIKEKVDKLKISNELKQFIKDHTAQELADFKTKTTKGVRKNLGALIGEIYRQESENMGKINMKLTNMEKIYKIVADKMVKERENGKTVWTGSSKFAEMGIVDQAYTKEENNKEKMSDEGWSKMKEKEISRIDALNKARTKKGLTPISVENVGKGKFIHNIEGKPYVSEKTVSKKTKKKEATIEKKEEIVEPTEKTVVPETKKEESAQKTKATSETKKEKSSEKKEEVNTEEVLNKISKQTITDIERRRQENLKSEEYRTTVSSELWTDEDGNFYKVQKQADGKNKISASDENGKTLAVLGSWDSSVELNKLIGGGLEISKVKDLEFTNKIVDKINAKYDAELAELKQSISDNIKTEKKVKKEKPKSFSQMTITEFEEITNDPTTPIIPVSSDKKTELQKIAEMARQKRLELEERSKDPNRPRTSGVGGDLMIEKAVLYMMEQTLLYTDKGLKSIQEFIYKTLNYLKTSENLSEEESDTAYQRISEYVKGNDPFMRKFRRIYELEDSSFASTEAMGLDSDHKVDSHRQSFSLLFKETAARIKVDKDQLEEQFYNIVQSGFFDNIETIKDYINSLIAFEKQYPDLKELSNQIEEYYTLDRFVSLINFYRNVKLTPQMGVIFKKEGIVSIKLLNEKSHARVYANQMQQNLSSMSKKEKKEIDDYVREKLIELENAFSESRKTLQGNELRKANYEASLKFLRDVTGTDWKSYFGPKTRETVVYLKKITSNGNYVYEENTFKSYESMMNIDPDTLNSTSDLNSLEIVSRKEKEGRYVNEEVYYFDSKKNDYFIKRAPSITSTISSNMSSLKGLPGIAEKVSKYFTETDRSQGTNSYSNFQKLSSTKELKNRVSLKGTNIEGDKFNSFRLYSHLQNIADNILENESNNELVKFYKEQGTPMELMLINGVKSEVNDKVSSADKITEKEYWITQLVLFNNGTQTDYQGSLGQFGDKKDIFITKLKKYVNTNIKDLRKDFKDIDKALNLIDEAAKEGVKMSLFKGMDNVLKRKNFVADFVYNYAMNMKDIVEIIHGKESDYFDKKTQKYSLADLVKRGSSTISSGYRLNRTIKGGVGKSFKVISAMDMVYPDKLGLSPERADGLILVSGNFMGKISKSQGSVYNKEQLYETLNGEEGLSSTKALISNIEKGTRGLIKGNWVNIDYLVEAYEGHPKQDYYKQLKEFIDKNGIDVLSFHSSTKKFYGKEHLELFDEKGNVKNLDKNLVESSTIDMSTEHIIIQQDLRHEITPSSKKMAVQLFANIMSLKNANKIFANLNEYTAKEIELLSDKLLVPDNNDVKLKLLLEEIDPDTQEEIFALLGNVDEEGNIDADLNASLHEVGIANAIQKILSSHVTKKALGLNMMRSVSQELPADKTLKELRLTKDKKHTLIPQVDIGGIRSRMTNFDFEGSPAKAIKYISENKESHKDLLDSSGNVNEELIKEKKGIIPGKSGIRYHDDTFKGNLKGAIKHINDNKDYYKDLFTRGGRLKIWELEDYKGSIPGSYVMTVRVPADDLHSHTMARARYQLKGNFIVLDKESQARSGSDYDGDLRYNSFAFKEYKNSPEQEKLANDIYNDLVESYEDVDHFNKIMMAINTKYFDKIVEKYKQSSDNYLFSDPFGISDARKKNIVGLHMKGIMTNALTAMSILTSHEYTLKNNFSFAGMSSGTIIKDKYGKMRNAIGILLNLAYDNAKNPKIEILGLNEITSNLYTMSLITDDKFDSIPEDKQDQYILDKVDKLASYMNSKMMQKFVNDKREAGGVNSTIKDNEIFSELKENYGDEISKELKTSYYAAMDLFSIKKYYELTYQAPNNIPDLLVAKDLHRKFQNNEFQIINIPRKEIGEQKNAIKQKDLSEEKTKKKVLSTIAPLNVFNNVDSIIKLLENGVFNHSVDLSEPGKALYKMYLDAKKTIERNKVSKKVLEKYGEPEYIRTKTLTKSEYESINKALNNIIAIEAIHRDIGRANIAIPSFELLRDGKKLNNTVIRKGLLVQFEDLLKNMPENKYLQSLQVENRGRGRIKLMVHESITFSQLSDMELKEIQNDFDKLPEGFKRDIILYMYQQYGIGVSSFNGSYHKLISFPYRIKISKLVEEEVNRWHDGFVSPQKLKKLASWLSKNIKELNDLIPTEMSTLDNNYIYDLAIDPAMNISKETLEDISNIDEGNGEKNAELLRKYMAEEGESVETFAIAFKKYKKDMKKGEEYRVQDYAKEMLGKGAGYELKVSSMAKMISDKKNKHCK